MVYNFPIWPERASTMAGNVDALYIFLLVVSGLVSALIFVLILVFAARFRKRPGHHAEQIEGSLPLELTWSIIPMGIFLVIFVWGAVIYFQERTPPAPRKCTLLPSSGCGRSSTWKDSARSTNSTSRWARTSS